MKWVNLIAIKRVAKLMKLHADRCKATGMFTVGLKFNNIYYELKDIIKMMERRSHA